MATFDKKGIYHSDLVKAGDVTVTITTEGPQKSKYAGKPDWVGFKCDGGQEHTINLENDECGAALTGYKGQTVILRGSGRAADARIEVFAADEQPQQQAAPPPRQQAAPQKPAQQQAAPKTQSPAANTPPAAPPDRDKLERKTYAHLRRAVAATALMMESCLAASRIAFHKAFKVDTDAVSDFDCEHMADIRATANTIFIESKNYVSFSEMPVKPPEAVPPKPAAPPPPPPPEPEPENELADSEIPF